MGRLLVSNQADPARDELSMGKEAGRSSPATALFSRFAGPAWRDALRTAEFLLQDPPVTAAVEVNREVQDLNPSTMQCTELSLDALVAELAAAERDSMPRSEWQGFLERLNGNDGKGQDLKTQPGPNSEFSEEVLWARSAQWGYEVVLKSSSRDSTPRTSSGSGSSSAGSSSASCGYPRVIPAVSARVKDALSSFKLAFLVSDATSEDFPILYASAGFTCMTGYTADAVVGKNCRFLQGADTDMSEVGRVRDALKDGRIYSGSLLNYKKDGTPFWNLLTISPIKDHKGKVIKYIGMQAERKYEGMPSRALKLLDLTGVEEDSPTWRQGPANSSQKPPVTPPKSSVASHGGSAIEPSDRQDVATRTVSRRYSLNSGAEALDEGCDRDSFSSRVSVEGRSDLHEAAVKPKTNRRSSRILRLFRKASEDTRHSRDTGATSRDDSDLSDSEEGRQDSSRNRRKGSSFNPRVETSSEFPMRLAPDALRDKLSERREYASPPLDGGEKRQFCIVHT